MQKIDKTQEREYNKKEKRTDVRFTKCFHSEMDIT